MRTTAHLEVHLPQIVEGKFVPVLN